MNLPDLQLLILGQEQILSELRLLTLTKRKEPLKADVDVCIETCHRKCKDLCPCCHERTILDNGIPNKLWEIDHWYGPSRRTIADIWPVCKTCNQKLYQEPEFKRLKEVMFASFQHLRLDYQLTFDFAYKI